MTILLDTRATHGFICLGQCARLAAALGLPPSGQAGPRSVATAAAGGVLGLGSPIVMHLSLGDALLRPSSLRESLSMLPMDMDVDDDLILGWDRISSHDVHHLSRAGHVDLRSGQDQLQLALLPASTRPLPATLSTVKGHGELRRLLRQMI